MEIVNWMEKLFMNCAIVVDCVALRTCDEVFQFCYTCQCLKHQFHLLPTLWNSRIIHRIQRVSQVLRHHNCAINRQLQVAQICVNSFYDTLHSVDFLSGK